MTTVAHRPVDLPGPGPRIEGLTARHLDLDRDLPALAELIGSANRNDGVDWLPTPAGLCNDFEHESGPDQATGSLVAWV